MVASAAMLLSRNCRPNWWRTMPRGTKKPVNPDAGKKMFDVLRSAIN